MANKIPNKRKVDDQVGKILKIYRATYLSLSGLLSEDPTALDGLTYKDMVTAQKVATTLFLLDECDGSPALVRDNFNGNIANSVNMRKIAEGWGIEGLFDGTSNGKGEGTRGVEDDAPPVKKKPKVDIKQGKVKPKPKPKPKPKTKPIPPKPTDDWVGDRIDKVNSTLERSKQGFPIYPLAPTKWMGYLSRAIY